jgi:hypothetical protein
MATQQIEEATSAVLTIGETAGHIWRILHDEGELRLSTLQKRIDASATLLHLALGWLAREDKIAITPDGRSYRVRLR